MCDLMNGLEAHASSWLEAHRVDAHGVDAHSWKLIAWKQACPRWKFGFGALST